MLGSPDNQELGNEAETYGALVESTAQIAIANAPEKAEALLYFKRGLAELEALAEHDPEQAQRSRKRRPNEFAKRSKNMRGRRRLFLDGRFMD
jgi:hypothetical protein